MPYYDKGLFPPQELINSFQSQFTPAARVPAVEISHTQWAIIQDVIRTLAELHSGMEGRDMGSALIQGSLLKSAAAGAWSIKFLAKENEEANK